MSATVRPPSAAGEAERVTDSWRTILVSPPVSITSVARRIAPATSTISPPRIPASR
jgi:hypothetical protein